MGRAQFNFEEWRKKKGPDTRTPRQKTSDNLTRRGKKIRELYRYFITLDGMTHGLKEVLRAYSFVLRDGNDEVLVVEVKDILRWCLTYHTSAEKRKIFHYIIQDVDLQRTCQTCGRFQQYKRKVNLCSRCYLNEDKLGNFWMPLNSYHPDARKQHKKESLRQIAAFRDAIKVAKEKDLYGGE